MLCFNKLNGFINYYLAIKMKVAAPPRRESIDGQDSAGNLIGYCSKAPRIRKAYVMEKKTTGMKKCTTVLQIIIKGGNSIC